MKTRISFLCIWFMAAGLVVHAKEPSKATVKQQAQKVGDATLKSDYATVVDLTWDGYIKQLGGRDNAIKTIEKFMKSAAGAGVTLKSYKVGEPGEFASEGGNTFVVVPTTVEMATAGGRLVEKSYLLAISSDGGANWKFVDGKGLARKESRDKVLPKLPEKLKLPEREKPELMKGN